MVSRPQHKYAVLSILLTLIAFAIFISVSYFQEIADYGMYLMVVGLALLIASWGVYFFSGRVQPKQELKETVITVIACRNCGQVEERNFSPGDYIFKDLGQCKSCSGPAYIRAIYSVVPKKE